jgi:diacylglycerol kinase family enzyme
VLRLGAEQGAESSGRSRPKAATRMPSLKPTRIAALLNESAGTVEREGVPTLRTVLAAAFEQHAMFATLDFLPHARLRGAAEHALRQARNRELDAVIVGGGDGSIQTVAGLLADSGVPLGILPLGTLNHFAKDLGIPLAVEEAIATIATGMTRLVDLGEVNGEIFINNSSIGFYPYLVVERERERRRGRLSKWAALVLAAPRVFRHLPFFRLMIRVMGNAELVRSPCVFVGNNAYHLTLPAAGTRGRLDRGELCLYAAKAQSRLALFWLACRSVLGFDIPERDLRIFMGNTAEISARRHWLLVATDGEVKTMRSPLNYRSRPGALRVFAPDPANG